jgi:hypothetical protein
MIDPYKNTIYVALFFVGLMGSIFAGFVSIAAAQSPIEMIQSMMMGGDADGNMTGMEANISKLFTKGTLEMPIMCTTPAQLLELVPPGIFGNATDTNGILESLSGIFGNATDTNGILESLSGIFGNATDTNGNATDTNGNATEQMMMQMIEQELKEEMNSLVCMPMRDENMTQSMMHGAMIQ